ncbi:MAG: CocE/NonD family hydrolase, partial [Litorilinea sp.]
MSTSRPTSRPGYPASAAPEFDVSHADVPEYPEYEVIVMEDVAIPMRDGVTLVADIYRPARNGDFVRAPLPILLERTPYDKHSTDRIARGARFFAQRGYIYVFQDCRGCYGSEGDMGFFWQEGPDGYDTVEWLAQQPWSNGKIGTTGTSY